MELRSAIAIQALRFAAGMAMLWIGGNGWLIRLARGPLALLGVVGSVALAYTGFRLAVTAITPLVRAWSASWRQQAEWNDAAREAFARASLPRRIYYLLASIADADAPMSPQERDAVRRFVLERFPEPVSAADLHGWEAQPFPVHDRQGLAARIAANLDEGECDSIFCWCCLVAFADGRFGGDEHAALQQVAKGLGIAAPRARLLFHLARAQYLRGDRRGERMAPPPKAAGDARTRALDELGLPHDATREQIRQRHRELARKFHPDAHPHLGPVAQKEATERFTAIQRAYETLTADGGAA